MGTELVRAYSLERDRQYIERVQMATVQGSDFAIRKDHGLFGSKSWWAAIRNGSLPTHRIEGVIVHIYRSGEWPEFEVEADGARTTWALDGDAARYAVGKRVQIDYVTLEFQKPRPDGDRTTRAVLGIWVEA
jgi:hypothetical protein